MNIRYRAELSEAERGQLSLAHDLSGKRVPFEGWDAPVGSLARCANDQVPECAGRYEADELNQIEAAEMLGVSERTFRRWCRRFEDEGEAGLLDRRLGRSSAKRVPADTVTLTAPMKVAPAR